MDTKRLNSLPSNIFSYKSSADLANRTIRVNSGNETLTLNRDKIISLGRAATVEYLGKQANLNSDNLIKYNSKVQNYDNFQHNVWADTIRYCAEVAAKIYNRPSYNNMEEVWNDRSLVSDPIFIKTLQDISTAVITPLYPEVIPAALDRMVDFRRGGFGQTTVVDIESNDFFIFDDGSWGSVSSKPYQYLYKKQIALTPEPYTAKVKIKWYQDVVGGEAGRYYAALMRGAYSKMYALVIDAFKKGFASTDYNPAAYTFDSFSMDNWTKAIMLSEAINGVSRSQLMAVGTLSALTQIVPTIGTPALAAGIQGQIGEEWVRNGFLGNVAGVDLVETGLAVVPGTQNYKPKFVSLDDPTSSNIYIMAKLGYAPMVGVIPDGTPIDIVFTPEETADMTINISETINFAVKPAFSSKIVKMSV